MTSVLLSALASLAVAMPVPRSGTPTEDMTYIAPIWEGALANHTRSDDLAVLSDMKSLLGLGGTYTKLGWSFSSWALSRDIQGASDDYNFDPTNLNYSRYPGNEVFPSEKESYPKSILSNRVSHY